MLEQTGDRRHDAEFPRLQGRLLLSRDPSSWPKAEAYFSRALANAKAQNAKSLELRAALALARSRAQRDERKSALEILAPVYEWFTEGFDTSDLREAKALIEQLA